MNKYEWDYLVSDKKYQTDWNETIQSKFNIIVNEKGLEFPVVLEVPNKLKPLIESLELYNKDNNRIMGFNEDSVLFEKYIVEYITDNIDCIYVNKNIELTIKNYSYFDAKFNEWHESDSKLKAHKYIGLNIDQYKEWVKDPFEFEKNYFENV